MPREFWQELYIQHSLFLQRKFYVPNLSTTYDSNFVGITEGTFNGSLRLDQNLFNVGMTMVMGNPDKSEGAQTCHRNIIVIKPLFLPFIGIKTVINLFVPMLPLVRIFYL